jgi:hypothetical protein
MKLILTFDDSAAGALKAAKLADCVVPFGFCFVWGRLPSASELEAFLSPRAADQRVNTKAYWLDNLVGRQLEEARQQGLGFFEFCGRFDMIELWAGPTPNEQLQLVWLLDGLQRHLHLLPKSRLVQTETLIGDHSMEHWRGERLEAVPIHAGHLETAAAAWSAWRMPTPVQWLDLLTRDSSVLPQLQSAVLALLEELPARATGLGATSMRLLELVVTGHVHPYELFPGDQKPNDRRTFGYWAGGELLDELARCPAPAIAGLEEGPFDAGLHDNKQRHDRYKNSRLSLTSLGQAILAQTDDFSRHNPIHRWWGGTELTNDRLWRWDARGEALIAP